MMQVGEAHWFRVGGWHQPDLVLGEVLLIEGEQVVIRLADHGGALHVTRQSELATEKEVAAARCKDLRGIIIRRVESLPLEALEEIAAIASEGEAA